MNPPGVAYVTTAFVQMLATVTGLPVGDMDAPIVATGKAYGLVDPIPGGYSDGAVSAPNETIYRVLQVTSVGATRLQAEYARDRFHVAILANNASGYVNPIDAYTLPGGAPASLTANANLVVIGRAHVESGGVDSEGPLFNAHERYELWVAPV